MLTTVAAVVADRLFLPSAFQLDQVRLEGTFEHVDPTELRNKILTAMEGNFFAVDLEHVERAVLAMDWVYKATVRRVWPDSIHVKVREQQPVARWGRGSWLNTDGEVITLAAASDLNDLVHLDGPPQVSREMLDRYRRWQALIEDSDLKIKSAKLTQRHAWILTLLPAGATATSISSAREAPEFEVQLGNRHVESRLQRFIHSYRTSLYVQVDALVRIDLRYPNGLAVLRRSEPESENKSESDIKT
jgi:cell division protein FtsQ